MKKGTDWDCVKGIDELSDICGWDVISFGEDDLV